MNHLSVSMFTRAGRHRLANPPLYSLPPLQRPRTNRLYQRRRLLPALPPPPPPNPNPDNNNGDGDNEEDDDNDIPELNLGSPAVPLPIQGDQEENGGGAEYIEDRTGGWVNFYPREELPRVLRERVERGRERSKREGRRRVRDCVGCQRRRLRWKKGRGGMRARGVNGRFL